MNIETKEQIQSRLDAREKLASLGFGELVELAKDPNKFDYFMNGLSLSINSTYVCYLYPYFGVIREMINQNLSRLDDNEKLSYDVFRVLNYIETYDKHNHGYKSEFNAQYESLVVANIRLDKLGISLKDFDRNAATYYKKIEEGNVEDIKTDKYYIATVSYLSKYHPEYFRNWHMLPTIFDTIYHPKKEDFEDKKDYKAFKKVASGISSNMAKYGKERAKVMEKVPHGYKW